MDLKITFLFSNNSFIEMIKFKIDLAKSKELIYKNKT